MELSLSYWCIARAFYEPDCVHTALFVCIRLTRIGDDPAIRCVKPPPPLSTGVLVNEVVHPLTPFLKNFPLTEMINLLKESSEIPAVEIAVV